MSSSPVPERGEVFVNLRQGHLDDDSPAPDTVLDGMGALNLGDDDDYGYFGGSPINRFTLEIQNL